MTPSILTKPPSTEMYRVTRSSNCHSNRRATCRYYLYGLGMGTKCIQGGRVSLDRGLSLRVVLISSEAVVTPEVGERERHAP